MSIQGQVLDALVQVSELSEVRDNLDLPLYDTHVLDSLRTVELILLLSERFNIEISPAEFDRDLWATPRKMVDYFEARMAP